MHIKCTESRLYLTKIEHGEMADQHTDKLNSSKVFNCFVPKIILVIKQK